MTQSFDPLAEDFPKFLKQAQIQTMDVNDWLEKEEGWEAALPIFQITALPYINPDDIILELGPGTGRWSRLIAEILTSGRLHLVDHSPWIVNFLRDYFGQNSKVSIELGDGCLLPYSQNEWLDVICCYGTFIELKLGVIYSYIEEFYRLLKSGGYCIFNYLDIDTEDGFRHLESRYRSHGNCFTYHTYSAIHKVFTSIGFCEVEYYRIHEHAYVVCKKQ